MEVKINIAELQFVSPSNKKKEERVRERERERVRERGEREIAGKKKREERNIIIKRERERDRQMGRGGPVLHTKRHFDALMLLAQVKAIVRKLVHAPVLSRHCLHR